MRPFHCACGHRVFFDNTTCVHCGRVLGFDPASLQMVTLTTGADGVLSSSDGETFRHCGNRLAHESCNWVIAGADAEAWCRSCRLNDVIPNLSVPGNLLLWQRLEAAKRRLLYSLLALGLPFEPMSRLPGMRFRFLEDRSRNPDVVEEFVSTGHAGGIITINVAEADDASRHAARQFMRERYRTLAGHFRHESGHYFFPHLVHEPKTAARFRELFGDERQPYEEALQAYYRDGPPADWPSRWVSAYAAAHPAEDWAESFAHYLHIVDAMETSRSFGILPPAPDWDAGPDWITAWGALAVVLNELNRGLGLDDPYPFVLPQPAVDRLRFIHRLIGRGPPG